MHLKSQVQCYIENIIFLNRWVTFGNTTGVYNYSDSSSHKSKEKLRTADGALIKHLDESFVVIDFQVCLQNHHQKGTGQNKWSFLQYGDIHVSLK